MVKAVWAEMSDGGFPKAKFRFRCMRSLRILILKFSSDVCEVCFLFCVCFCAFPFRDWLWHNCGQFLPEHSFKAHSWSFSTVYRVELFTLMPVFLVSLAPFVCQFLVIACCIVYCSHGGSSAFVLLSVGFYFVGVLSYCHCSWSWSVFTLLIFWLGNKTATPLASACGSRFCLSYNTNIWRYTNNTLTLFRKKQQKMNG